jgi:NADH dehydrogenase
MHNIVVIGGGFGGSAIARRLQNQLPVNYRLVLLSEESYTTFHPLLAEVVGAAIFPEQAVAPLRQVIRPSDNARFIMGRVSRIDLAAKTGHCDTLAGDTTIPYEHVVLALGNLPRTDFLPGLAEFALPLKTIGDAMEIRNVVLRRIARMELEREPSVRAALGHIVVIGGGFSGVEVAGELVDFLQSICRYYPW